jgi:hypothetical protein
MRLQISSPGLLGSNGTTAPSWRTLTRSRQLYTLDRSFNPINTNGCPVLPVILSTPLDTQDANQVVIRVAAEGRLSRECNSQR